LTTIEALKAILDSREKRMEIIKTELADIQKKFSDPRRTEIIDATGDVDIEDMIADEDMIITMTREGYIKRCTLNVYRSQGRGGRGVKGMDSKEDDFVETIFVASAHSYILFFTNTGRCYWLKVYIIPEAGRYSRGRPIVNLLDLKSGEEIASYIQVKEFDETHFIVAATERGVINKQPLKAYSNVRRNGINAINLDDGDRLIECKLTDGDDDIILGSKKGQAVRFHESVIRELGRNTRGVKGITLRGDSVIGMVIAKESDSILTVTENGYGKQTAVSQYRRTNRGGTGIINIKTTKRNGDVVAIKNLSADKDVMIITKKGIIIRSDGLSISKIGRNTQGVKLINLISEDSVIDVTLCEKQEEQEIEIEPSNNEH
jgi:DNA gyrase subunit A